MLEAPARTRSWSRAAMTPPSLAAGRARLEEGRAVLAAQPRPQEAREALPALERASGLRSSGRTARRRRRSRSLSVPSGRRPGRCAARPASTPARPKKPACLKRQRARRSSPRRGFPPVPPFRGAPLERNGAGGKTPPPTPPLLAALATARGPWGDFARALTPGPASLAPFAFEVGTQVTRRPAPPSAPAGGSPPPASVSSLSTRTLSPAA